MSSKLCRYALCPIFLTEEHKEQKQLIRIFSKVCLYVLLFFCQKNINEFQRKNAPDINFYTRNKSRKIMSETMMPRWVRRATPFSIATSSLSTKRANTFSA